MSLSAGTARGAEQRGQRHWGTPPTTSRGGQGAAGRGPIPASNARCWRPAGWAGMLALACDERVQCECPVASSSSQRWPLQEGKGSFTSPEQLQQEGVGLQLGAPRQAVTGTLQTAGMNSLGQAILSDPLAIVYCGARPHNRPSCQPSLCPPACPPAALQHQLPPPFPPDSSSQPAHVFLHLSSPAHRHPSSIRILAPPRNLFASSRSQRHLCLFICSYTTFFLRTSLPYPTYDGSVTSGSSDRG